MDGFGGYMISAFSVVSCVLVAHVLGTAVSYFCQLRFEFDSSGRR